MKDTMIYLQIYFTVLLAFLHIQFIDAEGEMQLYKKLFNEYVSDVRPRLNASDPVVVNVDVHLKHIKDVDSRQQILLMTAIIKASWMDDYLKWNPEDYENVQEVIIPASTIWLPDFGIKNSASSFYDDSSQEFRVRVKSNGLVTWSFGGELATSCDLEMTLYPYDSQRCDLKFENWAYSVGYVDLRNASDGVNLESYKTNGIWDITKTSAVRRASSFGDNPDVFYPRLYFQIYIQRKPHYYELNILFPCSILVGVALLVFWLPTESGERTSLSITVLLAFSVFQVVISDMMPENSDNTPILSVFVNVTYALSALAVVTSVLAGHIYNRHPSKPPPWLVKLIFLDFLAYIICVKSWKSKSKKHNVSDPDNVDDDDVIQLTSSSPEGESKMSSCECYRCARVCVEVKGVATELRKMTSHLATQDASGAVDEEWLTLIDVIDRLLFWLTLLMLFITIFWMIGKTYEDQKHLIPDY